MADQVRAVIVGEAYGENEARISRCFVGNTGAELFKLLDLGGVIELTSEDKDYIRKFWQQGKPEFLDMVWNLHPEIQRTNVFLKRPAGNKIEDFCGPKTSALPGYPPLTKAKYCRAEFVEELDRLACQLVEWNPNLIIAMGNTALWALRGITTISKYRGYVDLSTHTAIGFKTLPTYHPAAIFQQYELRPIVVADLMKASREMAYPEIRRPDCEVWIEPTLEDLEEFRERYIKPGILLSVDIETAGRQITEIGFSALSKYAIVIPFVNQSKPSKSYWASPAQELAAWIFVKNILENHKIEKLFQNGVYDIAFLYRSKGIKVMGATHDTMLLSHALQPESLKGLGFLGSLFTDFGAWKQMRSFSTTIKRED